MTPLRRHMIAALQLRGQGERTQQSYVREVRLLAQFYGTSPPLRSEQQLQPYFLHRQHVDGLAPASMRICYSGIRCCYQHVLKRDWHTLSLLRAQPTHRLPAVLSVEEVRRLLTAATPLHNQVSFTTVYSWGLRLHEALSLQVSDIDGHRRQSHGHRGKGAKDRYVPLPEEPLALLRTYWKTHRHPTWLFPATGRRQQQSPTATSPMRRASVQGAFRKAKGRAGMTTTGVAIPTVRPSYASHLREAGVNPRLIQRYRDHTRLETTVETATALSASITKPGSGFSTTWTNSSPGRTSSSPSPSLRPYDPFSAPISASLTRPCSTPRLSPANASPKPGVLLGQRSRVAPGSCLPGAGSSSTTPTSTVP